MSEARIRILALRKNERTGIVAVNLSVSLPHRCIPLEYVTCLGGKYFTPRGAVHSFHGGLLGSKSHFTGRSVKGQGDAEAHQDMNKSGLVRRPIVDFKGPTKVLTGVSICEYSTPYLRDDSEACLFEFVLRLCANTSL